MQRNQIYYIRLEIGMKLFNKYKFSDKRQSLGGIISTIMGLLALASLIYGGYAGLKVGSLGLLSLLISVIGTFIGLLSFKEDDKFYTLSKVGSMLCGILAVFMVAVFLMGL